MKKFLFRFVMVILGLYLLLHLILGSSPVQRRVVDEIRAALFEYGIDLQIESIEFSALAPRIYLNRVTVRSLPNAIVQIPTPLGIDKIKIEFEPIALISRRLVIDEAILFHPRIALPSADKLYKKVNNLITDRKRVEVEGDQFTLVVKKFGVVDAMVNVSSQDPPFSVRSRSISAFVQNSLTQQQTITISSRNLDIQRGNLNLSLSSIELDVDRTKNSIRVNRAVIDGNDLAINVKGAASLPTGKDILPSAINASYDLKLPLALADKIPELKAPKLAGLLISSGTVKISNGTYSGAGNIQYKELDLEGYQLGSGEMAYQLAEKKLNLNALKLKYGGGDLTSTSLGIELKEPYPISGNLQLAGVKLEGVLASLKSPNAPVRLGIDGNMQVSGKLTAGLQIVGALKAKFSNLIVLQHAKESVTPENTVIRIDSGAAEGTLTFLADRMAFQANVDALDGKIRSEGFVSYDNIAKVRARGEGVSLTKLGSIAELQIGGKTDLTAELDVSKGEGKIGGNFSVVDGELSNIGLGDVKGQAFYQSGLLSFENLEATTSLDPVRGNGFVDFNPDDTHYKFHVEGKRLEVNDGFGIFHKKKLAFQKPSGGEISARLSIEGGHDDAGLEIITSGTARNFRWYDEDWMSSNFFVSFRSAFTEVNRIVLMKKSGGMEIKARFDDKNSMMRFQSHGLKLQELQHLGNAPLSGEVVGQITLQGDLEKPAGSGEVQFLNCAYRDVPLKNSTFRVKSEGKGLEFLGKVSGESLRVRLAKTDTSKEMWDLMMYFEAFDMAPFFSVLLQKDIPTLTEVVATGDLSLKGALDRWESFKGSGTINELRLGLKGTPMHNQHPLNVQVEDGAIKVSRFNLIGKDSQLSVDYAYQPRKSISASLDGKVDLQFLQPFIPALESGSGKVSAGLRLSGAPSNFALLGNLMLEDGTFRLTGLSDDFKNAQVQLSLSQDKINVDRFQANVNGGMLVVEGDVKINQFKSLVPNLQLMASEVAMRTGDYLTTRFSGEFFIKGSQQPYLFGGRCRIHEAKLTKFDIKEDLRAIRAPIFQFDVNCEAKDRLLVTTDVMNAEFKGSFHLVGNNSVIGLLGNAEAIRGSIIFRERRFTLNSGNVRFESAEKMAPRFAISGRSVVKEARSVQPNQVSAGQEYEVNLQVVGVPTDYRIILTSTPELAEADIISLLLLGVTGRGSDGNYLELGTAVMGQLPIQSKLESQLGVDVRISTQQAGTTSISQSSPSTVTQNPDQMVPSVSIQKEVTNRTKVSFSNTLEQDPTRELKIEHMLDDNFTVNGIAVDRTKGLTDTQPSQSYGLDFRYRFQFE